MCEIPFQSDISKLYGVCFKLRPSFFNLLVYEKFFKKIESGGGGGVEIKIKIKLPKLQSRKIKKKIKRLSPIFFFFFFILIF